MEREIVCWEDSLRWRLAYLMTMITPPDTPSSSETDTGEDSDGVVSHEEEDQDY